jgi:hypothetical protein
MNPTKYKDVIIQGSVFPDAPINSKLKIKLNSIVQGEYIPTMLKVLQNDPKGLQLLLTVMTHKEGFLKNSRSRRFNNPANIGNTDNGNNQGFATLEDGIKAQRDYIMRVIEGKHAAYPLGKQKLIRPFYSPEIARNPQYGLPPYLPGYSFIYTGQLDQFVKIYSTGARAGNSYLSTIISYFRMNGIELTAKSKLQDIVKMG